MNNEKLRKIEKSITKKYRKEIWSKFIKGNKDFNLIEDNDKIAVCISGGKDGFLLAKCMQELKRHKQINFDLEFILMDPGFSKKNILESKKMAKTLNINLTVFKTNIFKITKEKGYKSPCVLCSKLRRGNLYKKAQSLGCNKIALGHHFNDVVETIMMNMIYNGSFSSMLPKLTAQNFKNMELIRPLYYVHEENIIKWQNYNNLNFANCECLLKEEKNSKRLKIKNLIKELKTNVYKDIDKNIYKSTINVNPDQLLFEIEKEAKK